MHLYCDGKLVMQRRCGVTVGENSLRGREELEHNECNLTLKSVTCQFRDIVS